MMKGHPNLFSYTDYRRFLADFYQERKKQTPAFSHRFFARMAGLASPSSLLTVIRGKKNLNGRSFEGFCRALRLSGRERYYFQNLVQFNQARSVEVKRYHYEQLLPVLKKENGYHLQGKQYEYYSKWYLPVIRELIAAGKFKEDLVWLNRKLRNQVKPGDIKKGIQTLLELNLIERDKGGRLRVTNVSLTTPLEVQEICVSSFHKEMLDQAKRSIKTDPAIDREISCLTAVLSRGQFQEIKEEIREFQNRLALRLEKSDPAAEGVYQINFQIFPLTEVGRGLDENE